MSILGGAAAYLVIGDETINSRTDSASYSRTGNYSHRIYINGGRI